MRRDSLEYLATYLTAVSLFQRVSIIMKPEELSETTAINTTYGTGTHV